MGVTLNAREFRLTGAATMCRSFLLFLNLTRIRGIRTTVCASIQGKVYVA
jgi:hypothetical protein